MPDTTTGLATDLATAPIAGGTYGLVDLQQLLAKAIENGHISLPDDSEIVNLERQYQEEKLRLNAEKDAIYNAMPALKNATITAPTRQDYYGRRPSDERDAITKQALLLAADNNPTRNQKTLALGQKIGRFFGALNDKNPISIYRGDNGDVGYMIFTTIFIGGTLAACGWLVGLAVSIALAPISLVAMELAPLAIPAIALMGSAILPALGIAGRALSNKITQRLTNRRDSDLAAAAENPIIKARAQELEIGLHQLAELDSKSAELDRQYQARHEKLQQQNNSDSQNTQSRYRGLLALKAGLDDFIQNNSDGNATIRVHRGALLPQIPNLTQQFDAIRANSITARLAQERAAARKAADEVVTGNAPSAIALPDQGGISEQQKFRL